MTAVPLTFYNEKPLRIIDIACGLNFTVVIAEKYETAFNDNDFLENKKMLS